MTPGADECRQAANKADCVTTARAALKGYTFADSRRLSGGIFARQLANIVRRYTGDRGDPFRRILRGTRL
jgi:hypothetical protein